MYIICNGLEFGFKKEILATFLIWFIFQKQNPKHRLLLISFAPFWACHAFHRNLLQLCYIVILKFRSPTNAIHMTCHHSSGCFLQKLSLFHPRNTKKIKKDGNVQWHLPLSAPPPLMALISIHFFTPLFSFAIESYLYETDFTPGPSQNYHS